MSRAATSRPRAAGYQVLEYLGSGARSTIWSARSIRTGQVAAIKRVFKQPGDDGRYFEQACNEFRIARQFDHAHIRKYYALRRLRRWLRTSELHLFMELCPGQSVQASRPSDVAQVVRIFSAVGEALGHMHSRGYLHADMKPNNILVAPDGGVKIIDFGQSCPLGTVKARIQGTPDFIAPEQVHRRPLDARTDVFNFGATLYWALTGQPIPTILPKQTNGIQLVDELKVKPPEELNAAVPPGLGRLVLDCIETQPSRRPQSMREVVSRLDLIAHTLHRDAECG